MKKIVELGLLNMQYRLELSQKTTKTNQTVEYEKLASIPIERAQLV